MGKNIGSGRMDLEDVERVHHAIQSAQIVSGSLEAGKGIARFMDLMDDHVLSLRRSPDGDLGADTRCSDQPQKMLVARGDLEETSKDRYRITTQGIQRYLSWIAFLTTASLTKEEDVYKRIEFLAGDVDPKGSPSGWSFDTIPYFLDPEERRAATLEEMFKDIAQAADHDFVHDRTPDLAP